MGIATRINVKRVVLVFIENLVRRPVSSPLRQPLYCLAPAIPAPAMKPGLLTIDPFRQIGIISRTGGSVDRKGGFQRCLVVGRELDPQSCNVFIEVLTALCARDWNNLLAARQEPGKSNLRVCAVVAI